MISAKEANEKTKETIKDHTEEELDRIETDIMSAISDGEYELQYRESFMRTTIVALKSLEYNVEELDQVTIINWE